MQTITWSGTLAARSSIAHIGEVRGTISLLRRELIAQPDGSLLHVPVISGNTWRGRLRRVGEELLRDELGYEGLLSPAAAHALRGGGALAKTSGEPLSGNRLRNLRALVPQISIFGAAAGGRIIDGALDVGKVIPVLSETSHITAMPSQRSAFEATQLEAYTRQDDTDTHDFSPGAAPAAMTLEDDGAPAIDDEAASLTRFLRVETFPAGTTFATWLRLRRVTELELAFFLDVLTTWQAAGGHLGGRTTTGHGMTQAHLSPTSASELEDLPDWRSHARTHRSEILEALGGLS